MNELFDQLELELRRIPSVTGVGLTTDDDGLVVYVSAEGVSADRTSLRSTIAQQIRGLVDGPVAIEIDHIAKPASVPSDEPASGFHRPPRVRLVDVEVEGYTSDVVVRLTHAGRQSVGRGEAGSPADAARATMRALNALGAKVPFSVRAIESPVGTTADRAVVVMLEGDDERAQRYGIARAHTLEEAACRATLHALNRYLADTRAFAEAI
jgi:hypothetical protein